MELVIKTFLGLFFMLLLMTGGISLISAQTTAENARDFKNMVLTEILDSEYDADTINYYVTMANDMAYDLTVILKNQKGDLYTVDVSNPATVDMTAEVTETYLKVKYLYEIPFIGMTMENSIYSYA
ncbi:MAG: hypothetical protein K6E13_10660 [Lachnospiraceae bacterium]|nr:hypothetical protein [Lachnospiraceae bacterium]